MTILKKLLIFNAPQKERICMSCNGTGKTKEPKMHSSTMVVCMMIGFVFVLSTMGLFGSKPNYFINLPLFAISATASILALMEHREQTMGDETWKKKNL